MALDYLKIFEKKCDLDKLLALYSERSQWINRKANLKYKELLASLPTLENQEVNLKDSWVKIGNSTEAAPQELETIQQATKQLIPWRKGPFNFFNQELDAEWRSDFKWDRIKKHLGPLTDKVIMDIGCNNGYFMFKMAAQKPRLVMGIDPMIHNLCQFELLQKYAQIPSLKFELFGVEHLNLFKSMFDVIFSMGILYHHRHPLEQLLDIRNALKAGGTAIIETIGIPGEESSALFPEDRYCKMRNVWFLPTLTCLKNWALRAKFVDIEVISATEMSFEEQRLTSWCPPPYQSLEDFLDPNDSTKTIEGYPAPMRFCILVRKKAL